ncbi:MAG: thiamine pyrophosphate-binding protein [Bryobacteraceae bacterium]|nr:thiamine pyrophosphate-binding protein [Bryobacteraceae bacterium]MDW8379744.1 thiamine pyrophosphate-binding protein [Bryobacterales bacterium]
MTSVEHAVAWLQAQGVDWMATLCGHGLDPLFRVARERGIRLIDTRNEQTASYIAECYGRLTRRAGVCAVSSGVAHVNALCGVANAWFDGAPMLLISGAAAHRTMGLGHFQDLNQVALAAPITRYARVVDHPDRTLQIFEEAWSAARNGPAHITYPMDVQLAEVRQLVPSIPLAEPRPYFEPEPLVEALGSAQRPVVVAGSKAWYHHEEELILAFCEALAIPLVTPVWDRGVVGRPSSVFAGVVGALTGGPRILQDADLLVMAGARADYRLGFLNPEWFASPCRVIPAAGAWRQALELATSVSPFRGWLEEVQARRQIHHERLLAVAESQRLADRLHAVDILEVLRPVVAAGASLIIDGGSIGQWAHHLLTEHHYPSHWLSCGPSGVVGYGLGGAMAARLANPQRPVVLLSGDGAFTFNVADLECAVRQKLPLVAIVADDQGWGITRLGHIRQFGEPIASSLGPVAFAQLAASLGAQGCLVTTREQLSSALTKALETDAVTVIHVPVAGGNPSL